MERDELARRAIFGLAVGAVGLAFRNQLNRIEQVSAAIANTDVISVPETEDVKINSVDYFFNRSGFQLAGLSQVRVDNHTLTVKAPYSFEVHEMQPDGSINLIEDHPAYTLQPGRWLPASMTKGEVYKHTAMQYRYSEEGLEPQAIPFDYSLTLLDVIPQFAVGGDLGEVNAARIGYVYGDGSNGGEIFTYAKGIGMCQWERINADGKVRRKQTYASKTAKVIIPRLELSYTEALRQRAMQT